MKGIWVNSNLDKETSKVIRDFNKYDTDVQKNIHDALKRGTKETLKNAKSMVPKRTGRLMTKISMNFNEKRNAGYVVAKSNRAHLIEKGTKSSVIYPRRRKALRIGDGFVKRVVIIPARKAKPFLVPALKKAAPQIEKDIKAAIENVKH